MPGIFIHKSMNLGVPTGGVTIEIDDNGDIKSNLNLHLHYEITPKWIEIMIKRLIEAQSHQKVKLEAWKFGTEDEKAATLENELESSIQAIIATGIAMDAFYATIAERTPILDSTRTHWRKSKTARHTQICEVLRRAYGLPDETAKHLRVVVKDIFKFRDLAVHPAAKLDAPAYMPELDVAVEQRFAAFQFKNAVLLGQGALNWIWELVNSRRSRIKRINTYNALLIQMIEPQVLLWTKHFGELNPKSKHKPREKG